MTTSAKTVAELMQVLLAIEVQGEVELGLRYDPGVILRAEDLAFTHQVLMELGPKLDRLLAKSQRVVDLLADAEANHGGLLSVDILRAGNELRLELAGWKGK